MSAIRIPRVQAAAMLSALSSGCTKLCLILCTDDVDNSYEVVIKWRGKEFLYPDLIPGLNAVRSQVLNSLSHDAGIGLIGPEVDAAINAIDSVSGQPPSDTNHK